jgi:hypothetical protein
VRNFKKRQVQVSGGIVVLVGFGGRKTPLDSADAINDMTRWAAYEVCSTPAIEAGSLQLTTQRIIDDDRSHTVVRASG